MKETITLTISKSVGYSGKGGIRQYIARITGTSKQYIFERSFEDTECTDKVEMFRSRRKGKGSWTEAAALPPGLYERSRSGDREYLIVYMAKDGTGAKWKPITEERCIKMACLLDDGESFDEAMKQTSPPKVAPPEVAESGK